MKSKIAFIVFFLLMLFRSEAQNVPSFSPFKGFHVGLTGQAEFIKQPRFYTTIAGDPTPRGVRTYGWEAGIEFSYHFAKYFGVSIGLNYGTALSYDCSIYWQVIPGFNDVWGTANDYRPRQSPVQDSEFMFPIKFEFHYPLHKNLFFTADAGVKLKGIQHRLSYGKDVTGRYSSGDCVLVWSDDPNVPDEIINYFDYVGKRKLSKIHCDLLLGIGFYYKLPYGDLLRLTAGLNVAFGFIVKGDYIYHLSGSEGKFDVKNDFIYTQLSYIHTLNWQKAKKYLQKNDYSFATKQERRKKIVELVR